MNNKIKINNYIRTCAGIITKAVKIDCNVVYTKKNESSNCLLGFAKKDIINQSPNLIKLLQVGDYVNGHLVVSKYEDENCIEECFIEIETECSSKIIYDNEIKTIVTKEQFEQIVYKTEGTKEKRFIL